MKSKCKSIQIKWRLAVVINLLQWLKKQESWFSADFVSIYKRAVVRNKICTIYSFLFWSSKIVFWGCYHTFVHIPKDSCHVFNLTSSWHIVKPFHTAKNTPPQFHFSIAQPFWMLLRNSLRWDRVHRSCVLLWIPGWGRSQDLKTQPCL